MPLFISLHSSHGKDEVLKDGIVWAAVLYIVKNRSTMIMIHKIMGIASQCRSISMNFSPKNVELGTASFHLEFVRRLTSSQHPLIWRRDAGTTLKEKPKYFSDSLQYDVDECETPESLR
jgi:hypothetical protein